MLRNHDRYRQVILSLEGELASHAALMPPRPIMQGVLNRFQGDGAGMTSHWGYVYKDTFALRLLAAIAGQPTDPVSQQAFDGTHIHWNQSPMVMNMPQAVILPPFSK